MATDPRKRRYVDHYKGERKQNHRTPRDFFEKLDLRYGFTLDGAAAKSNTLLPRFSSYHKRLTWRGERVFCNPPWSNIAPFVELAATAELAVLLIPSRTNCGWFHRALELGAVPDYWQGKLNFGCKWNSPTDCLLLIWESGR